MAWLHSIKNAIVKVLSDKTIWQMFIITALEYLNRKLHVKRRRSK